MSFALTKRDPYEFDIVCVEDATEFEKVVLETYRESCEQPGIIDFGQVVFEMTDYFLIKGASTTLFEAGDAPKFDWPDKATDDNAYNVAMEASHFLSENHYNLDDLSEEYSFDVIQVMDRHYLTYLYSTYFRSTIYNSAITSVW